MNRLQGKIALITGGNSGIGLATAQLFAQEGAQVIITGRDQATLDQAAAQIGNNTLAVKSDVSSLADLDALFADVKTRFGGLDILFANAGILRFGSLQESTEALFDEVVNVNLKGVFFAIQKAEPLLRDGGAVVINASTVAHVGTPGAGIYAATKGAVRQLARTFRAELSARRIRVNVVSPGVTRTAGFVHAGFSDEQAEGLYNHFQGQVPVGRAADAIEIAKAVLFLASDDSSYVVGEEILVDGGYATIGLPGVQR